MVKGGNGELITKEDGNLPYSHSPGVLRYIWLELTILLILDDRAELGFLPRTDVVIMTKGWDV